MGNYLLRIEAVNLEQITDDTDQLSVIRGGSWQALAGAKAFQETPISLQPLAEPTSPSFWRRLLGRLGLASTPRLASQPIKAENIAVGASVGLYRVDLPEESGTDAAETCAATVAEHLRERYPHHTFVVDLEPLPPGDEGFSKAHEMLIARNRFRQLQQLTLALPEGLHPEGGVEGPCRWDDLRPASTEIERKLGATGRTEKVPVSASAKDRFDAGKGEEKKKFLHEQSGIEDLDYTNDFEELATGFDHDYRLDNKLAVLYFDGNGFGSIQDGCKSPQELHAFDEHIRGCRKALLAKLLNRLRGDDDDPDAFFHRKPKSGAGGEAEKVLRFELLLWGGDEILFVVPAWKGLDALLTFYEASRDWTWGDRTLTHAGALIFCHHKTPIARMTALARELAGRVKERKDGRKRNLFDYLILESVDFPAEPLGHYLAAHYRHLAGSRRPLSPVTGGRDLLRELAALRDAEALPRGKLHEGALDLIVEPGEVELLQKRLVALEKTLTADEETAKATLVLKTHLASLLPEQEPAWQWLHLAEFWDYLAPRGRKEAP